MLALADELAIHERFDPGDAISLAVALMLEGAESEAAVLIAAEPESDPPNHLDLEPLVRQMLKDAGVKPPAPDVIGWGIAWREASKLASPSDRPAARSAIIGAFDFESRADEVWWLLLAEDESVAIDDEKLQSLRVNRGSHGWEPFYSMFAVRHGSKKPPPRSWVSRPCMSAPMRFRGCMAGKRTCWPQRHADHIGRMSRIRCARLSSRFWKLVAAESRWVH